MTKHPNSLANLTRGRSRTGRARYSYATLAKMSAYMMTRKFTVAMLAQHAGISRGSAARWTQAMWDAGCIHVVEYLRSPNGRTTARVYQWGKGESVPKPVGVPRDRYHREYRQRRKTLEGAWRGIATTEHSQDTRSA